MCHSRSSTQALCEGPLWTHLCVCILGSKTCARARCCQVIQQFSEDVRLGRLLLLCLLGLPSTQGVCRRVTATWQWSRRWKR